MRKWEYVLCAGVGGVSMVGCGWGGTTPTPPPPPPGISSPPVGASAQKVRTTNVPPTILPAQAAAWRALVRTAHRDGMPMPPAYLQLSPSPALRHSGMWAIANDAAQNAEGVPVLWWGFRQPHKAWVWVPLPIDGDPQNPGYGPANTMMYWTDAVEYGGQTLWPPVAGGTESWQAIQHRVENPVGWTLAWVPGAPALPTTITVWWPAIGSHHGCYGVQYLWDAQNMWNGVPMVGAILWNPDAWSIILQQARAPNQLSATPG